MLDNLPATQELGKGLFDRQLTSFVSAESNTLAAWSRDVVLNMLVNVFLSQDTFFGVKIGIVFMSVRELTSFKAVDFGHSVAGERVVPLITF